MASNIPKIYNLTGIFDILKNRPLSPHPPLPPLPLRILSGPIHVTKNRSVVIKMLSLR